MRVRTLAATGKEWVWGRMGSLVRCAYRHLQPVAQGLASFRSNSGGSATVSSTGHDIHLCFCARPWALIWKSNSWGLAPPRSPTGLQSFQSLDTAMSDSYHVTKESQRDQVSPEKIISCVPSTLQTLLIRIPMTV